MPTNRIENQSSNIVFEISNTDLIAKVPGDSIRLAGLKTNVFGENIYDPQTPLSNVQLGIIKRDKSSNETYHSAGRALRGATIHAFINHNNISDVVIPRCGLIYVAGNSKLASDQNYLYVEQKLTTDNIKFLTDEDLCKLADLPLQNFINLLKVMKAGCLWDFASNIGLERNTITLFDVEARNISSINEQFMHYEPKEIHNYIESMLYGMKLIYQKIESNHEKKQAMINYLKELSKDSIIISCNYYKDHILPLINK